MTEQITFTPERARLFEKAYNQANENGREDFTFDGHVFVTNYAKYVVEYLKLNKLI